VLPEIVSNLPWASSVFAARAEIGDRKNTVDQIEFEPARAEDGQPVIARSRQGRPTDQATDIDLQVESHR